MQAWGGREASPRPSVLFPAPHPLSGALVKPTGKPHGPLFQGAVWGHVSLALCHAPGDEDRVRCRDEHAEAWREGAGSESQSE